MKLLLTSSGITNDTIAQVLADLTGKKPADVKIGFVPTAANGEPGDKHWLIADYVRLWKCGYEWIDIVDPSAADVDWRSRLEEVDVVFVSGGNTFHLLKQTHATGFDEWLRQHRNDKVLVGSSAGSILMTPAIAVAEGVDQNDANVTNFEALGFVDFEVIPHVPGMISREHAETYAQSAAHDVYAIDDTTAVKVVDSSIEVVTEGEYKLFDKPAAK